MTAATDLRTLDDLMRFAEAVVVRTEPRTDGRAKAMDAFCRLVREAIPVNRRLKVLAEVEVNLADIAAVERRVASQ